MFITLEGPDGSGKTSHMQPLAKWLEGQGYRVHTAREPGGTLISEQIRNILHDLKNTEMHPHTETLLYQAARAQIVEQVLRPKLAAGWIVLCDRYADSTLAYQGYGNRQSLEQVRALVQYATGGLLPDLTLLLDLPVETGLARARRQLSKGGRPRRESRFEDEALQFHERVRAGYLELARLHPERFRVIDAAADEARVKADIERAVAPFFAPAGAA